MKRISLEDVWGFLEILVKTLSCDSLNLLTAERLCSILRFVDPSKRNTVSIVQIRPTLTSTLHIGTQYAVSRFFPGFPFGLEPCQK